MTWQEIMSAPEDPDHPWRLPVLGTTSHDGCELRTVVLRGCNIDRRTIYCHTDLRSPKVHHIQHDARTTWLFYHPESRIQLRIVGESQLHHQDDLAEEFWNESDPASLNLYRAPHPPGAIQPAPDPNLPEGLRGRPLTREEVEPGRELFVLIETRIDSIDWLQLSRSGSLRALFTWDEDGKKSANWVSP